jgi:hypothetical protein
MQTEDKGRVRYPRCGAPVSESGTPCPRCQLAQGLGGQATAKLDTLGVVYYWLGQFDKAAETLLSALGIAGSRRPSPGTLFVLAMTYHHLGQTAKAGDSYAPAMTRRNAERARNPETEGFFAETQALLGKSDRTPLQPEKSSSNR